MPTHKPTDTAPGKEILARTAHAAKHAIRAGQFAPAFRLQDIHGNAINLIDLVAQQALVISFYRGIWCSFCDTALSALARIDNDIRALGARHIAIGPATTNDHQRHRLEALRIPVLIDPGLHISSAYGLTISVPAALHDFYAKAGYVPQQGLESSEWLIPIPATYVIDPKGRVVLSDIDTDYRNRFDPLQLLSALQSLQQR